MFLSGLGALAATALLGFWLQSIGAAGGGVAAAFGFPSMLWPLAAPAFGGAVFLGLALVNRTVIQNNWRADFIEKPYIRPVLALLLGPALALLIQAFVGLDHFGLTTKTRMLGTLAFLQMMFFLAIGNYATTLKTGAPGGFRTPWTLKSGRVWAKTHRLIGRGLVGASLLGAAALFFIAPRLVIMGHMAAIISIKAAALAYSFFIWHEETQTQALDK